MVLGAWTELADVYAQATTELISVSASGGVGNAASEGTSMSADGRWVVFDSTASDLIPGDLNGFRDIFARDRWSVMTLCISRGPGGVPANGPSDLPVVASDGTRVAFVSQATNLIVGDTNARRDAFYCDLTSPVVHRASLSTSGIQADQHCQNVAISGDGRFIAFDSTASTLVPGDTNGVLDVFVYDTVSGVMARPSVNSQGNQADGPSQWAALSTDGHLVVFDSIASNLVAGDTNGARDVFLHDMTTGITTRLSVNSTGAEADGASAAAKLSGNGRFVAFESVATNLVTGDSNAVSDVFVRDLFTGNLHRASVSSTGTQGNAPSGGAFLLSLASNALSYDGRFVTFTSAATNLQPGDDFNVDVFVHDQILGQTERVSLAPNGQELGGSVVLPTISGDGSLVAMMTDDPAAAPGDSLPWLDVFVRVRGSVPVASYCDGTGSVQACPCGNGGLPDRGCNNSAATGGAWLFAAGVPSLSNDTLTIISSGERATSLTLFLQGSEPVSPEPWADGLRCIGGTVKRLYSTLAGGGAAFAPPNGEPSISMRSRNRGDDIRIGESRYYQTYYRDSAASFCASGGHANSSNGIVVVWGP